ncbi:hypothetical protein HMPREF2749_05425 [Rothia sp. HMSC075F09]|nr:hypothetical protein HMPREF2749_05425 [Rothia sp. HMSC075F09]
MLLIIQKLNVQLFLAKMVRANQRLLGLLALTLNPLNSLVLIKIIWEVIVQMFTYLMSLMLLKISAFLKI